MRVIVPLIGKSNGNAPFYYLVEKLRHQMEFVIVTSDPAVVEECESLGLQSLLLEATPPKIPQWIIRRRYGTFGKNLYEFLEEYQNRRQRQQQAALVVQALHPDAVLMAGDFRGLLYSLCQQPGLHTVVVQVTLDWVNLERQLQDYQTRQGRRGVVSKWILRGLGLVLWRRLMGRVAGRDYLIYGNDLGRTLGAALAGVRLDGVPLKGGMAARAVCVNGEHYRQNFIRAGIPAERVLATGSPDHDLLYEMRQQLEPGDAQALRRELGIPQDAKLIAFFTQPFDHAILPGVDYPAEIFSLAQELSALDSQIYLVVKLHPQQKAQTFAAVQSGQRVRVLEGGGGDAFNNRLIYASDLVLLRTSTVGYAVLGLDVPLLTYELYGLPAERYFADVGASWHVTRREDLAPSVKKLLFDPAARAAQIAHQQAARQGHMLLDGRCAERIGAVLLSAPHK